MNQNKNVILTSRQKVTSCARPFQSGILLNCCFDVKGCQENESYQDVDPTSRRFLIGERRSIKVVTPQNVQNNNFYTKQPRLVDDLRQSGYVTTCFIIINNTFLFIYVIAPTVEEIKPNYHIKAFSQ